MRTWVLLFLLLPFAASCADDETALPPSDSSDETAESWPETRPDTLLIEGEAIPVTSRLYDKDGVPFITYLPENDLIGEVDSTPEGERVLFFANFGELENRDAYLSFFFPVPGLDITDVPTLRSYLVSRIERNGWTLTEHDDPEATMPCPWAQDALTFRDEQTETLSTGYACLGMHGDTPFYLLTHVPVPYSEGLGPRITMLLDTFRWRDTGQGLEGRRS